jgi:copper transport protein
MLISLMVAGLFATALSVGLQGLDALDLGLVSLGGKLAWETGLHTSYGLTAIALGFALFGGLFSFAANGTAARSLALAGIVLTGLALSLSGHASSAAPQVLTRPSVFVHVICVAIWIGALAPLAASIAAGDKCRLARFTRMIPYSLALLIATGVILAWRQLDRIDALWTTSYGLVLVCKLVAVAALLALAAANRYALAPRYQAGSVPAQRSLTRTMAVELCIAGAIFALVALWRFTPPPRALAASPPIEVHLHDTRAMAHITLIPVRARDPRITVQVFDGVFNPLAVKEVTLTLANPAAGIEPVRRTAVGGEDAQWRVEGLRIPVAGRWTVGVDLLIDDFEKIRLEDAIELPRLP